MVFPVLLDLDGDHAVLGSGVERLYGSTVSSALDVFLRGTSLLEEVYHGLDALLGEGLIDLGGAGLLVGVAVDGQLGVGVDQVVGEVLQVSLSRAESLAEPRSK